MTFILAHLRRKTDDDPTSKPTRLSTRYSLFEVKWQETSSGADMLCNLPIQPTMFQGLSEGCVPNMVKRQRERNLGPLYESNKYSWLLNQERQLWYGSSSPSLAEPSSSRADNYLWPTSGRKNLIVSNHRSFKVVCSLHINDDDKFC